MRGSGAGGRDSLMTAVPLAMLVLFVVWMNGGPRASLRRLERTLESTFAWVTDLVR